VRSMPACHLPWLAAQLKAPQLCMQPYLMHKHALHPSKEYASSECERWLMCAPAQLCNNRHAAVWVERTEVQKRSAVSHFNSTMCAWTFRASAICFAGMTRASACTSLTSWTSPKKQCSASASVTQLPSCPWHTMAQTTAS